MGSPDRCTAPGGSGIGRDGKWLRYSGGVDAVSRLYGPGFHRGSPPRFTERERRMIEVLAAPAARRNRP